MYVLTQRVERQWSPVVVVNLQPVPNYSGLADFPHLVRKRNSVGCTRGRLSSKHSKQKGGSHLGSKRRDEEKKLGEQIGGVDCGSKALRRQELGGFCLRIRSKHTTRCCDGPVLCSPIRHSGLKITTHKWAADVGHQALGCFTEPGWPGKLKWTGRNMLICLPHPECWWPSAHFKERPNVLHVKTGCWWGRQKTSVSDGVVMRLSQATTKLYWMCPLSRKLNLNDFSGYILLWIFYVPGRWTFFKCHIWFCTFRLKQRLLPWTVGLDYSTVLLSEWGNA